jgi:hypothetical protein
LNWTSHPLKKGRGFPVDFEFATNRAYNSNTFLHNS